MLTLNISLKCVALFIILEVEFLCYHVRPDHHNVPARPTCKMNGCLLGCPSVVLVTATGGVKLPSDRKTRRITFIAGCNQPPEAYVTCSFCVTEIAYDVRNVWAVEM